MSHINVDDMRLGSFCHSLQKDASSRMGNEGLMMSKYLRDNDQRGTRKVDKCSYSLITCVTNFPSTFSMISR